MKPVRVLLGALAVVVVAGTIATAAPGFHVPPKGQPAGVEATTSPEPSETESPEPEPSETESPEPEPSETESPEPEPSETESVSAEQSSGTAPDFSACAGLTGLDNAICRHEALLQTHPDNPGLANSLEHLQANLAKHAARTAASSSHGASAQHGSHGGNGGSGD